MRLNRPMSCMIFLVAVVERTPWLCSRSAPPPDDMTITHSPRYGNNAKIVFWAKRRNIFKQTAKKNFVAAY